MPTSAALADDAVFVGLGRIALLDGDDIAAGALVEVHHAGQAARVAERNHVGQKQRERLVADDVAGAPDRMAEPMRRLLAGEADGAGRQLQCAQRGKLLHACPTRVSVSTQFGLDVEIVLDDMLVAAGHEDDVLDARLQRLVDGILHDGTIDDGQHFLRHRLGGGQETRAETGNRYHCFSDFSHRQHPCLCVEPPCPIPISVRRPLAD